VAVDLDALEKHIKSWEPFRYADVLAAVDELRALREADALKIVETVRADYPEDVFPAPTEGCAPDLYTAAGCRLACDRIREEILRQRAALSGQGQGGWEEKP